MFLEHPVCCLSTAIVEADDENVAEVIRSSFSLQ